MTRQLAGQLGVVYLLHFDRPYQHARHYVGPKKTCSLASTGTLADTAPASLPSSGRPGSASPSFASAKAPAAPNAPSSTPEAQPATARPARPGRGPATGHRSRATSSPAPTPTQPEGRRPAMPKHATHGTRIARTSPYLTEHAAVTFHRSAAGMAWRWRTELTTLTLITAALLRLHYTFGDWIGRPCSSWPSSWSWPSSRQAAGSWSAGSGASWSGTASTGCAGKPGCTPVQAGSRSSPGCAHQGGGAGLAGLPGRSLRRRFRRQRR